jgi:integrase
MRPITPQNNKGIWALIRFVPKHCKAVDPRKVVKINTGIRVADDPAGIRAYEAVQALNGQLEAYWRGLAGGRPTMPVSATNARQYLERMREHHLPAPAIAFANPIAELARQVALLMQAQGGDAEAPKPTPTPQPVRAAAKRSGPASSTKIALSGMLKEYEVEQRTHLAQFSPDQLRRWRHGKQRAIDNLISVIGQDVYIGDITRDDALDFRQWWQDRVVGEGIQVATANKDLGHLNRMLKTLDRSRRLGLEPVFAELRIEGERYGQRSPYAIDFVQDRILADGALDDLNPEARRVVYVCAESGLRPVEVVNLNERSIRLDCDIPHVLVVPEGRVLKTDHSERHIPLVGVALAAMRAQPQGFPAYFDKSAALSATVNKFLKSRKLRPTDRHSLYSLRHTFEDRLTAAEPPEKIQAFLMGHRYDRPKYGSPPSLEQLKGWLDKIALRPPASI